MHSEGILAGELKHGPLALVDKEMPVIMIIMRDACYNKCQNALQQITARSVNSGRTYSTCNRPLSTETHALSHKYRATNDDSLTDNLACVSVSIRVGLSSFVARMTLT